MNDPSTSKVLETDRLVVRRMAPEDAGFILELLNEPTYLRFIGDKGVQTLDDARGYIADGPAASYERHGFGLYLVATKDATPVGTCGLLKRDNLDDPDLGFAFKTELTSRGFAYEAAVAVLEHARTQLGLERVLAVTAPDNARSIRLLEKLGFEFERMIPFKEGSPEDKLFVRVLRTSSGAYPARQRS